MQRHIEFFQKLNEKEIIIIGGYKHHKLKGFGKHLIVNDNYHKTNMVWSLFCARDFLNEDSIITYGDCLYHKDILKDILLSPEEITVAIDMNWASYWHQRSDNPLSDAESLKINHKNELIEIGQIPQSLDEIEAQYMGLIKVSKKGCNLIQQVFDDCKKKGLIYNKKIEEAYMTDLLQELIARKIKIKVLKMYKVWIEIDTTSDYELNLTKERLRIIDDSYL